MSGKELNEAAEKMLDRLSPEAWELHQYLSQYRYCISRKKILERRKAEIIREFDHPIGAIRLDGMPHGSGAGYGAAALPLKLEDVIGEIEEQNEAAAKALKDIVDVIHFLPENSMERNIVENRYIDRYEWRRVCRENHITRTPATKCWRRGLYMLLDNSRVQEILEEYRSRKENC